MLWKKDPRTARQKHALQTLSRKLERVQKNASAGKDHGGGSESTGWLFAVVFACTFVELVLLLAYAHSEGMFDDFLMRREENAALEALEFDDDVTEALAKGYAFYHGLGVYRDLSSSFAHYLKAARAGSAPAQHQVGKMFLNGEGVARDKEWGLSWLRKSAAQGHVGARLALGALYAEGEGTPEDRKEAVSWLHDAARQGNAEAQDILKKLEKEVAEDSLPEEEMLARAYACLEGKGVPQDKTEAARWFRKAAGQGHGEAQYRLAMLFLSGDGVPKDKAEAVRWFSKAAEQGHGEAQYRLAMLHLSGDGVPKDKAEAVRLFSKAAEQGHGEAQYRLAMLLLSGDGVRRDTAEATRLFRKAAEQGHAKAQFELAVRLFKGDDVPQDKAQAAEWHRKAAEQGLAEAQCSLGDMLSKGDGVPKDEVQAVEWYRKAAGQGLAKAQFNLGVMLFEGDGVPRDPHEAVSWIKKAADQGDRDARAALQREDIRKVYGELLKAEEAEHYRAELEELMVRAQRGSISAQYQLGRAYAEGSFGLTSDMEQAVEWYRKAAKWGHEYALERLIRLYSEGRDVPRDMEQVIYWSRKLAEKREYEAYTHFSRIARIYAKGDGVPRDMEQAAVWGREAALMGDVDAPIRLARMYADGNGVPRDMGMAILWYHWAASTGSGEAMLELGRIYAEGDGVPQDSWMAAVWYCKAHDNGQILEGQQAVKDLGVDIYDIRMKGKVMKVLLGHRMEMAKCKLMHAYGEGWASRPGKARAAELRAGTARLAAYILKELAALKEEKGDDLPPRIMQLADAIQAEAEELQRMKAD